MLINDLDRVIVMYSMTEFVYQDVSKVMKELEVELKKNL